MSEWRQVRLRDITTHIKDGTHGTHRRVESGVPLLSAKNVGSNGRLVWDKNDDLVSEADYSAITATFTPKQGDLLLTIVGSVGRSALFDGSKVAFQRSVAFVRSNETVLPAYLFHASSSEEFTRQLERRSNVTAQAGLYLGELAKVGIPLPPTRKQQEKIAAILTSLDMAIEKTEALIEKHQQIKAGLMHDLFTRGVLPNGQLRPPREQAPELYRETSLGQLPNEWQPSSCGQTCSIDSGITLGPHRRPGKRAHPYLRVANVYRDEIRLHDVAMLEALPSEADFGLRTFDLLVVEGHANTAQIGRCAMVHNNAEGMLFQNHLFRLRATSINPHFALLWMNSHHAQRYWERVCATSSGLNTINRKMLNAVPVFAPPEDEQVRITDAVAASRDRIASEVRQLDKLHTQKLGLMQDLLTGKVPVKVTNTEAVPA